jgi:DNA-binding NarL/FixJ family response regulator
VTDTFTVLVADDHGPTRAAIRRALERGGLTVCGEAADAAGAVAVALEQLPDLCLLDIRMPGNGVSAAWEISARLPETKIVMLTVSRSDDDLFAALRAGATGYLLKDIERTRLPQVLRDVVAGEATLSQELLRRVIDQFRDSSPKRRTPVLRDDTPLEHLTSREWEVLELMRQGHSTAEIADMLFVSATTVRTHVAAVLRKLRVPNREAAVQLMSERPNNGR